MTTRDPGTELDPLEREAHRWLARLVSGEATTADAETLKRWRLQSSAHDAAFVGAVRRWKDYGAAGRRLRDDGDWPAWVPPPMINRRAMLGGVGGLVAASAAYSMAEPPLGLWPSFRELAADYRTGTGEQRRITVADNVSVRMNTQTSLSVPSSERMDRVRLIAGEASFAMPPDSGRSLEVVAGNIRALANRARFAVRSVGPSLRVTCFEGEVRVEQGAQTATIGSKRQVRDDGGGLQPAVSIDEAEAAAWQDGVLIFRFTPLSEVIAEINRYRPGKVILMNAALGPNPVNGRFNTGRIEEVLVWIEQAFGANSRALPGGVLLLS